jgi:hypothetical protein
MVPPCHAVKGKTLVVPEKNGTELSNRIAIAPRSLELTIKQFDGDQIIGYFIDAVDLGNCNPVFKYSPSFKSLGRLSHPSLSILL